MSDKSQAQGTSQESKGCTRHKRCIDAGVVNCIRGVKKPNFKKKYDLTDGKTHIWRKVSSNTRPDGVSVTVEKCKLINCDLWRWIAFEWHGSDGKAKMVPTVQYMKIAPPKT